MADIVGAVAQRVVQQRRVRFLAVCTAAMLLVTTVTELLEEHDRRVALQEVFTSEIRTIPTHFFERCVVLIDHLCSALAHC